MNTVKRVARNTSIVMGGDIIFRLISLFVMIYLARYLGVTDYGKYSFVFAYLAFFNIITDLGLQRILVREMARDESIAPKLIGNAYIIRGILAVIAVVSSVIIISLASYPADTTTYIHIASFTLLFISFSDFYRTIFEANLKMEYNTVAKLAFKILSAGFILWIIYSNGTLMQIMIVLVFSEGVKTLLNYLFSRKFVRPKFEIDFKLWKFLLKECLPIALTSIIWVIYYHIDVVMLSPMMGDEAVGIYSAAHKLCDPFFLIPSGLTMSLFPLMSAYYESSENKLIKTYTLGVRYLLIIMLPIAVGITLLADDIIFIIYGTEFIHSTTVLQILIWSIVFSSINSILLSLLISINRQKLNTLSTGVCAFVNVILNLILIPILSYNGASIATVVTNMVLFTVCFYFVSKHLQVIPVHKMVVKPVISGLVMGAFIYYFTRLNIFLLVPLAGIVYLMVLLTLKTFNEDDWEMVKKVLGRRRLQ
ncbi:MAG: flippase [Thermotogota bacterium]|nr:flippase [Thermotogota bacterium]